MSMIGEYFRLTTAELERALEDPEWALDFIDETRDAEEESEPSPAEARHFSTYKTWDLLGFLLRRAGCPVDVVHGEEPLGQADDWGYGPPRYLPVERVRLGAEALDRTPYGQLIAHVDHQELMPTCTRKDGTALSPWTGPVTGTSGSRSSLVPPHAMGRPSSSGSTEDKP